MLDSYLSPALRALEGALDLLVRLSIPIAIAIGLVALSIAIYAFNRKDSTGEFGGQAKVVAVKGIAWVCVCLLAIAIKGALGGAYPTVQTDLQWRENAEATQNPVPDAPPVYQPAPSFSTLAEETYTRTLKLPPDFLDKLGTEGIGVLSPYLTDPTAENVLKLADTFRRSGQDVVFTRELTKLAETPVPFESVQIDVDLKSLPRRAFSSQFTANYTLLNDKPEPVQARFIYPLPDAGTIKNLAVSVGGENISQPTEHGWYEWNGTIGPNERKTASVSYAVHGAKSWSCEVGSSRRRVKEFSLSLHTDEPAAYRRGSLERTSETSGKAQWNLKDVITSQEVAIVIPSDTTASNGMLQAFQAMPISFLIFAMGLAAAMLWRGPKLNPGKFSLALGVFAAGMFSAVILQHYIGPIAALVICPVLGSLACFKLAGRTGLIVGLASALMPAAFLSAKHSGLIILVFIVIACAGLAVLRPSQSEH